METRFIRERRWYFSTTGGIIEGQGATDNDGIASVTLYTGNAIPSNGFAIVTAQVATSQTAGSYR